MVRSASFALLALALLAGSALAGTAPPLQLLEGATPLTGASSSLVNYGTADVAVVKSKTFTLRNTGSASISIDQYFQIPFGFTMMQRVGQRELPAGASTTFALALNAARAGYFAGNVVINTSAGTLSFPVEGSALGVPSVRVVDNTDAGFRVVGRWVTQNGVGLQGSSTAIQPGTGTNVAAWTFRNLTPGLYQVSASWTAGNQLATNARYTLVNGADATTIAVNQRLAPSDFQDAGTAWQHLGRPFKIDGHSLVVQLSDLANGAVVADAVRIERVGYPGQIQTVGSPGFRTVGQWTPASKGGAAVQSVHGSATWTFQVKPGQYRVSANWLDASTLTANAQYTVADGSTPLATAAINQQLPPQHFRDAGARWQDLGPIGGLYTVKSNTLTVTLSQPPAVSGPGPNLAPPISAGAIRIERYNDPTITTAADVIRFLEQATWGPTPELAQYVESVGIDYYLFEQLAWPMSQYPLYPNNFQIPNGTGGGCANYANPSLGYSYCVRDYYSRYWLQNTFYLYGLYGWDQLRQRATMALHKQIVVGGTEPDTRQFGRLAPYLRILTNRAFGNFRTILDETSKNAAMGSYLDNRFNTAAQPQENFAREILQLFSIGLDKLNADGTPILDGQGNKIPTYDQAVVNGFTRAFTGWQLAAPVAAPPPLTGTVPNYHSPLVAGPANLHSTGTKLLLDGVTIPAGGTTASDMTAALNNIFAHANNGPFLAKNLIQHFVTSNPTPGYVARVSYWFDNDGTGVRGNLTPMIYALLVDPEARNIPTDPDYGKMREPAQLALNLLRAFNATSHDGTYYSEGYINPQTSNMSQNMFDPPSVFSYFTPDNNLPGSTTLLAPEFQIYDTATAIRRINFVNTMTFGGGIAPQTDQTQVINSYYGTALNLTPLVALANDPAGIADYLDDLLLHGTMSTNMRNRLIQAITDVPTTLTGYQLKRARTAVYLVATSSQYQIQR